MDSSVVFFGTDKTCLGYTCVECARYDQSGKEIIEEAHNHVVPVLIDGAQAVPHLKVDVQDLDAEFYVFSGHKIYGPTGIGVLYGKEEWLDKLLRTREEER